LVTESLQQEIESLIKVSRHPYVAQLVGLSINPGHGECSIIMEYINGNLRKLIDTRMKKRKGADGPRRGPFDLHEELLIISKIALGMAYLHSRGLVHRDLNPHNVLAQQSGIIDVKIVDFGISHLESSDIHVTYRYYTGMGTRFYRAPEMMPIDPKEDLSKLGLPDISSTADLQALKATDVFSFAMTCYEVLTGKAPFEAELSTGSMHESDYAKVRSEDRRPPWPARPDPEPKWSKLKSLVEGCWVRIPKDRPTFDKVCKELMEISRS
jgi:serine/threonine protein kinase